MRMAVFTSERFRPFLPDGCQVNPNVLGFELASWLSESLARNGVVTSYPSEEDWGWYLEFADGDLDYQICCSGAKENESYEWRVFVVPLKRFLRSRPPQAMADELFESVLDCLKESGIEAVIEDA